MLLLLAASIQLAYTNFMLIGLCARLGLGNYQAKLRRWWNTRQAKTRLSTTIELTATSVSCSDGKPIHMVPCLVLPVSVVAVQIATARFSILILGLAVALALALAVAVPKGLLNVITSLLATALLLSASYVDVLERALCLMESSRYMECQSNGLLDGTRDEGGPLQWETKWKPAQGGTHKDAEELAEASRAWIGETLSVVLPCAYEGAYASRTVESIWSHTTKNRLREIIVVDDGSIPKLELTLPSPLRVSPETPGLRGQSSPTPTIRLLRHEKTLGLIAAKKTGGDAALGDVIVFFDCHVKPRDGWEEAFLKQMHRAGDHRTLVVPTITALDPDTWEENAASSSQACYMTWNADFTWLQSPGRDVPVMSGGLLAISKLWWEETGGYDDHMIAWGGENIDQSLRSWLCGGRIEVADGAFVAHMWRDPNNPKTQLKYTMRTEDVMRNKARAVSGWLGPYANKTFTFPEYNAFFNGENSIGDLSNFEQLRQKLKCAPFSAYLHRFSYIYVDGGLIPQRVFQIQEVSSGLCLEREAKEGRSHGIVLSPCVGVDGIHGRKNQGVLDTQLWHPGNRDRKKEGGPCCGGLLNWNFLQCLASHGFHSELFTEECVISGHSVHQEFHVPEDRQSEGEGPLTWREEMCALPEVKSKEQTPGELALQSCAVRVQQRESGFTLQVEREGGHACVTAKVQSIKKFLHNFQSWEETMWSPAFKLDAVPCPCAKYRNNLPDRCFSSGHVAAGLEEFEAMVPGCGSITSASAASTFFPGCAHWMTKSRALFDQWLKRHRLPTALHPMFQKFCEEQWLQHVNMLEQTPRLNWAMLQKAYKISAKDSLRNLSGSEAGPGAEGVDTITGDMMNRRQREDDDNLQIFVAEDLPDESVRVKLLNTDLCLDSSAGNQLVPYPCYADSQENPNQAWKIQRSRLVWEDAIQSVCVDAPVPPGNLRLRKLPPQPIWTLAPCVDKVGQRLQKEDMKPDGTFLLKDVDAGRCLADRKVLSLETPLILAPCNDRQRFRELKERNQVQHVSTGYCVDAGNDAPILYPCHEPKALRKQRFEVKDTPATETLRSAAKSTLGRPRPHCSACKGGIAKEVIRGHAEHVSVKSVAKTRSWPASHIQAEHWLTQLARLGESTARMDPPTPSNHELEGHGKGAFATQLFCHRSQTIAYHSANDVKLNMSADVLHGDVWTPEAYAAGFIGTDMARASFRRLLRSSGVTSMTNGFVFVEALRELGSDLRCHGAVRGVPGLWHALVDEAHSGHQRAADLVSHVLTASGRVCQEPPKCPCHRCGLHVSENGNQRAQSFDLATCCTTATQAVGAIVLGCEPQDLACFLGSYAVNRLRAPTRIDAMNDELFIADTDNHRVLRVSNSSVEVVAGTTGIVHGLSLG
eukprot:s2490_g15.t1